jgi:XTP/dITP diphosphohydrolase
VRELLVATGNKGKLAEIGRILDGCVERLYSLADFPDIPPVTEDGATFEANARKKAMTAALATGIPVLADDSGLVVDALGGRPGVFSARFAGEGSSDADNNEMLLRELAGVAGEKRTASFRCAVALCFPDGSCRVFQGELNGVVLDSPRGDGGFGYDPLFLVPDYGKTLAELDMDIKNRISHRGKALKSLSDFLSRQSG